MTDARDARIRRWTRRTRAGLAVAIAGAILALGGALIAATGPLPRGPVGGAQVDIPEEITVTLADGSTTRLIRDSWNADDRSVYNTTLGPSTWVDQESYALDEIPLATADHSSAVLHPRSRVETSSGYEGDVDYDPVVSYFAEDVGVLPETTTEGYLRASTGTDVTVTTDVPYIRGIYTNGQVTFSDDPIADRSAWLVEFDLAAAYANGSTNLTVPLNWYGSWWALALNASWPWLVSIGIALIVFGTGFRWWSRAERLESEALVPTNWSALID